MKTYLAVLALLMAGGSSLPTIKQTTQRTTAKVGLPDLNAVVIDSSVDRSGWLGLPAPDIDCRAGSFCANDLRFSKEIGSWGKTGILSITENAVPGPLGGTVGGGALVKEDSSNGYRFVYVANWTSFGAGETWAAGLYGMAKERSWGLLTADNGAHYSYFNIGAGTCATGSKTASVTATAEDVGGGWCRMKIVTSSVGVGTQGVRFYLMTGDGGAGYQGDGASGLYIAGATLEKAGAVSAYCEPGPMNCVGATPTRVGSTVSVLSAWDTGARFDGAADRFDLGNVANATSGNVACIEFMVPASGAGGALISKWDVTTAWMVYLSGGVVYSRYCSAGTCTNGPNVTPTVGMWHALCASYLAVGAGTSVGRMAMDGVVATAVTSLPLMQASTDTVRIGAYGTGGVSFFPGSIRRVSYAGSVSATDAQLARATAAAWTPENVRPPGTVLNVTHNEATNCERADGTLYSTPPGTACIGANGIVRRSAGANELPHSDDFADASWVLNGTATKAARSTSCPLGPNGLRMALIGLPANNDGVFNNNGSGYTTNALSAWIATPNGAADCTVSFSSLIQQSFTQFTASAHATRRSSAGAANVGAAGFYISRYPGDTCTQVCISSAQAEYPSERAGFAGPYHETTTARVTWTAPRLDISGGITTVPSQPRGCVSAVFTPWANSSASCRIFGLYSFSDPGPLFLNVDTSIGFWDGVGIRATIGSLTLGSEWNFTACWDGLTMVLRNNTTGAEVRNIRSDWTSSLSDNRISIGSLPNNSQGCAVDVKRARICRWTSNPLECQP